MTLHQAQQQLLSGLYPIYGEREAATIADWVMENITGLKKMDRILNGINPLSRAEQELLKKYSDELLTHRPVQYVLQESWFYGMKFYVDEHVLIPRPETEELVEWVLRAAADRLPPFSILDVGTGSGCIPVTLKKKLPRSSVYACDISREALAIAERNASANDTVIHFRQLDFLNSGQWDTLPAVDILISNPPYIPLRDKDSMRQNVVGFEPHLALFVPDEDPHIFYNALADFAKIQLLPGGELFVELHEELAAAVSELFLAKGLSGIIIKKDMQGKDRLIKATWLP